MNINSELACNKMDIHDILGRVKEALSEVSGVEAIVLGGSRITGTEGPQSDIDVGIYYNASILDFEALNAAASRLDDSHRKGLIGKEGDWGPWVNFGAWLQINDIAVDLIFRDIARVKQVIQDTNQGTFQANYQPGHPHAYMNYMYRGKLAFNEIIFAREASFSDLKILAQQYPSSLQHNLLQFFGFEAEFYLMLAKKNLNNKDPYYFHGLLFKMVSAFNQVIFAKNKIYMLNEKKAVHRIMSFQFAPINYSSRIEDLFYNSSENPQDSLNIAKLLLIEIESLVVVN